MTSRIDLTSFNELEEQIKTATVSSEGDDDVHAILLRMLAHIEYNRSDLVDLEDETADKAEKAEVEMIAERLDTFEGKNIDGPVSLGPLWVKKRMKVLDETVMKLAGDIDALGNVNGTDWAIRANRLTAVESKADALTVRLDDAVHTMNNDLQRTEALSHKLDTLAGKGSVTRLRERLGNIEDIEDEVDKLGVKLHEVAERLDVDGQIERDLREHDERLLHLEDDLARGRECNDRLDGVTEELRRLDGANTAAMGVIEDLLKLLSRREKEVDARLDKVDASVSENWLQAAEIDEVVHAHDVALTNIESSVADNEAETRAFDANREVERLTGLVAVLEDELEAEREADRLLRRDYGAKPGETPRAFVARLRRERDEAVAIPSLECLREPAKETAASQREERLMRLGREAERRAVLNIIDEAIVSFTEQIELCDAHMTAEATLVIPALESLRASIEHGEIAGPEIASNYPGQW